MREDDRQALQAILADGQLLQRVTNRARALLAFNQGEHIGDVVHWLNWSRMGLWCLWRSYEQYGVDAIFDPERSGRPPVFSPTRTRPE